MLHLEAKHSVTDIHRRLQEETMSNSLQALTYVREDMIIVYFLPVSQ